MLQTVSYKRTFCSLLTAPKKIPDTAKVKEIFDTSGFEKSVTKTFIEGEVLTVRTSLPSLLGAELAALSERLKASDVDVSFTRSGLVLFFHY